MRGFKNFMNDHHECLLDLSLKNLKSFHFPFLAV